VNGKLREPLDPNWPKLRVCLCSPCHPRRCEGVRNIWSIGFARFLGVLAAVGGLMTEASTAENFGFALSGVRAGDSDLLSIPGPGSLFGVLIANNVGKSTFLPQLLEVVNFRHARSLVAHARTRGDRRPRRRQSQEPCKPPEVVLRRAPSHRLLRLDE
jgi:hypothetical protein